VLTMVGFAAELVVLHSNRQKATTLEQNQIVPPITSICSKTLCDQTTSNDETAAFI
jgi:hypothetical protein